MWRPTCWQDRSSRQRRGPRALSIRSPTAISRRSPASWSTGRARSASQSVPLGRAPNVRGSTPCGVDDLPRVLLAKQAGGVLEQDGMVEVVSSLERDGRPVFRDLRWGVYVVVKAPSEYARACFKEYGLKTDATGW